VISYEKKFGTVLDEELLFKVKQVALNEKQTISQLLEDAIRMYLEKKDTKKQNNISQNTYGTMKISKSDLREIMKEKGVYEI
jgi:metal-responsive CopG/Arc/MetJ family transcriptional regulator